MRKLHYSHKIIKYRRLIILIGLFTSFLFSLYPQFSDTLIENAYIKEDFSSINNNLKISGVSEKIHVNDNWSAFGFSGSGSSSQPYVIEDLVIDGGGSGSCIFIENSNDYFIIRNCTVYNSDSADYYEAGIRFKNVSNGILFDNNCSFNNRNGIFLESSNNNNLTGNTANNNNYEGIYLRSSNNNIVSGNIANNNGDHGIYLNRGNFTTISGNTAFGNNYQKNGIYLYFSNNNKISGNTVYNHSQYGIILYQSDNNTISGNNATYNLIYGVTIQINCYNNTISGNIACNNGHGFYLYDSNNNTILGNTFKNNSYNGIYFHGSNNNNVLKNIIANNTNYGITLESSNNTLILGNSFNGNGVNSIYQDNCENNDIRFNLCDNILSPFVIDDNGGGNFTWSQAATTLAWLVGSGTLEDPYIIENLTINGDNSSSCIEIKNSNDHFIIRNCICYNSSAGEYPFLYAGIYLYKTTHGVLSYNNCSYHYENGIYLKYSNNTIITGNTVRNNTYGICYYKSHNNTVAENVVYNNPYGIQLDYSDNNTVVENFVNNNSVWGIELSYYCNNNTLTKNLIDNNYVGITIWSGDDNIVYNNIFTGNQIHAKDNIDNINEWDNGIIGNYWDNYTEKGGVDANNDGIGDQNYTIFSSFGEPAVNDTLPIFKNPLHQGEKIHIDDSGVSARNWSQTVLIKWWCTGSGTESDPYVIKDLVINGYNSSNCILIENSNDFFVIKNCKVYNSSDGTYDAGIKLYYTRVF